LYATACDQFRNSETNIHSEKTYAQLQSIEGATLSAPQGMHDDRAMSYVLALQGVLQRAKCGTAVLNSDLAPAVRAQKDIFRNMPEGVNPVPMVRGYVRDRTPRQVNVIDWRREG